MRITINCLYTKAMERKSSNYEQIAKARWMESMPKRAYPKG